MSKQRSRARGAKATAFLGKSGVIPDKRKGKMFAMRMRPDFLDEIEFAANARNMTISGYLRFAATEQMVRDRKIQKKE